MGQPLGIRTLAALCLGDFPLAAVLGVFLMENMTRKWLLTSVALLSLASATFADKDKCDPKHPKKGCEQQMPEGGSSLVYLLGAGVTCLGAMMVRSRAAKPKVS